MRLHSVAYQGRLTSRKTSEDTNRIVEIDQVALRLVVDTICTQCRYPLLALRLLLHVITAMDEKGRIAISARHLSKKLGVHYDTVTKCLKYLREIEVLRIEK